MRGNRIGNVALAVSVVGMTAMTAAGFGLLWLLPPTSLICPVGVAIGLYGLKDKPRRSAAWAIAIGLRGSAYIATIWLPIISR